MKAPSVLDKYSEAVDAEMASLLAHVESPVVGMITYHLGWTDERGNQVDGFGGKKLRSTLCLLACEATGGAVKEALPAAAAVEMVHNFSLIQDDIQDDDRERRHRPTVWSVWGKPQALNAVTAMHVLAGLALARLGKNGTTAEKQQRAQLFLNQAILDMVGGQYRDISLERDLEVDVRSYLEMIGGKTAALISCSMGIGALLGTDDAALIEGFRRFGRSLGAAFQIKDDVLGTWGLVEETGKPNAGDILKRKKTLPIVFALQEAGPSDRETLVRVCSEGTVDPEYVSAVLAIMNRVPMPPSPRAELCELASFLVDRVY
jgi:geranylgeranyl diphosphate synthase type I